MNTPGPLFDMVQTAEELTTTTTTTTTNNNSNNINGNTSKGIYENDSNMTGATDF
jgi:hypothetical protein